MLNTVQIKNIGDISPEVVPDGDIRGMVNCVTLGMDDAEAWFGAAVFLNAYVIILVLNGTGTLRINYKPYTVERGSVILLSASHLFGFGQCSADFGCRCLMVSREFMAEMDSTDMIYRRIKYGVKLYNTPVVSIDSGEASLLSERMAAVGRAIDGTGHLYYKEVILNSLLAFYLDLSDMIDRRSGFGGGGNLTRYESIIKSFIELLADNYRREHKVGFYASRLHISAHYLTLIVKRITGQSVRDLIFEMLYSDARTLLYSSRLSVQEVAMALNFADQSSFGKFFRRRAGVSPVDYRRNRG